MLETTPAVADQDEDQWITPASWWARGLPIRSISPLRTIGTSVIAASEIADLVALHQDTLAELLKRMAAAGAGDVTEAATKAITDPASCSPFGAAVLSYVLDGLSGGRNRYAVTMVDAWLRERGVVFATEATVIDSALRRGASCAASIRPHMKHAWRAGDFTDNGLIRMRGLLACAEDEEYGEAVARLRDLRATDDEMVVRVATSFLAPTERGWCAADIRDLDPNGSYYHPMIILLLASVGTRAELQAIADATHYKFFEPLGKPLLYTAFARLGPDCAGVVDQLINADMPTELIAELADLLAQLPSDEAFAALVARIDDRQVPRALAAAAQRFPLRALRLLRPLAGRSAMARHLLRCVGNQYPHLAGEVPAVAGLLQTAPVPTATSAELPGVLRTPPWEHVRKRSKPVVIIDLIAPRPSELDWVSGEREEWEERPVWVWHELQRDWQGSIARAISEGSDHLPALFACGPVELVRPRLATARPGQLWQSEDPLRRMLARFDVEALGFVSAAVHSSPAGLISILLPATGTSVTLSMIRWLDGKTTRQSALEWFERHLGAALPDLIAAALVKPGKNRMLAESALRTLAERGHRNAIESAAIEFDDKVATAISAALDADPMLQLPTRIPALPSWLVRETLPSIKLRNADAVLSVSAAQTLCTMLSLCGPAGDYAGVAQVSEAANPASLAEFAWGLFESWRLADYPAKDGWVLHALGLLGTDETARRLGPLIRMWPGQASHSRAVSGLDVLTTIGSHTALMELYSISEKVKFKALKTKAQEKITAVADNLDLTREELADRLVPDFGLDTDGTLILDYGPRGFVVGFDEQLNPTVFDAIRNDTGAWQPTTTRKTLPKPAAADDQVSAPVAYQAFATLKKEVKSAATEQVRRFEQAMVHGRRWSAADHRRLFVDHPLLWHVTRRLVWAIFDEHGNPTASFRLAEDRTYADASDDPVTLADEDTLGIAHPLHLNGSLSSWAELFADYEILQPFTQLHRETHTFTPEERTSTTLTQFTGKVIYSGKILGLKRFGWQYRAADHGDVSTQIFHVLNNAHSAVIDLSPGLLSGDPVGLPEQQITVRLTAPGHEFDRTPTPGPTFGDLNPITASELLTQLHQLS